MGASEFSVSSESFADGARMGAKFATRSVGGGENTSPQLSWKNAPLGTKSFAVTCIDLHPVANNWVHWMVVNIPSNVDTIGEGAKITGGVELQNGFGRIGYGGPQPPKGSGDHKYVFTVYALNVEKLNVGKRNLSESEFLKLLKGKMLGETSITGIFSR